MRPVAVRILHPDPGPAAGPIERWVAAARASVAERHRVGFEEAGSTDVRVLTGPPDDTPFGRRLRDLVRADRPAGLVILGSGAIPLATAADRREFVAVAASEDRRALANNRYSADIVAIAHAGETLADVPDLAGDNALPRWLDEVAGYAVGDLRRRWRLAVDIDGPLDVVLTGGGPAAGEADADAIDLGPVSERVAAIRRVAADPSAELARRRADVGRDRPMAGAADGIADAGPHRGAWHADARRGPAAGCIRARGACSSATGRDHSGTTSLASATRRSSTPGSCWPIGSAPTRRAGRRPRTGSRRTCCSPTGSRIRGCGP